MSAISRTIDCVGSASRLAKLLDVSVQAVCFWRDGKRSVPANRCLAIERATGGRVTRAELRPQDAHLIWPDVAPPADAQEEKSPAQVGLKAVHRGHSFSAHANGEVAQRGCCHA